MKEHTPLGESFSDARGLIKYADAAVHPPAPYMISDPAKEEVTFQDYWGGVHRRLWLVVGVALLITVSAMLYMARQPDVYMSTARVEIGKENLNSLGLGDAKSNTIASNDPAYFNTQLEKLMGPGHLRRVAKALDLKNNPDFLRPLTQNVPLDNGLRRMFLRRRQASQAEAAAKAPSDLASPAPKIDPTEAMGLAPYVGMLQKGLTAVPVEVKGRDDGETRLIDINYSHPDPRVAALVANTIADVFIIANLERKTETNANMGRFLQDRISDLQSQIRASEAQLISYAKGKQILSLDPSQNTVVDRLVGLNKQLMEAENERMMAEATYKAALTPSAALALVDQETTKKIVDAETRLAILRQKRAELLVDNTEEWYEVKNVNQEIAELEKQVKDARGGAVSSVTTNLETRYRQALAREQDLRASFSRQRGETLAQNEAAVNYRIIQQEIDTNKTLLEGLLQRSKENSVMIAGIPNNFYVTDYAVVPDSPVGPRRWTVVGVALLLSLAFGVCLALLLEYLDRSIRSASEVRRTLRLPTLAVIPSAKPLRRRAKSGSLSENGERKLLDSTSGRSPLAEAYRRLRTSVIFAPMAEGPARSLLVTSSVPDEGKTTTAVNIAMSLAQTGEKVLLVDADFQRPCLHTIFGVDNESGLSTALSGEPTDAELAGMIQPFDSTGLSLLASGPIPPNPTELLGSAQMRGLMARLTESYGFVVIDSPPVATFTDGLLISSVVDGVLLVVHGGKTPRDAVLCSRQLLQSVGAKVFGVVLNNVNLRPRDYAKQY